MTEIRKRKKIVNVSSSLSQEDEEKLKNLSLDDKNQLSKIMHEATSFTMNPEFLWHNPLYQLREAFISKKWSYEKLSEKSGYSVTTIERIFEMKFAPKLDVFMKLANVLNCNFVIETENIIKTNSKK